jgi:hypothetical protein
MRLTRRNALIGLGTVAAGAGVIGGTGAFTSVEAERTVNISTAGDGSAALTLEGTGSSNANEYVSTSSGTIQLDLDGTSSGSTSGLNKNAKTTIDNLVKITNNGSQHLTKLNVEITNDSGNTISGIFKFTKGSDGGTTLGNNVDLTQGSGLSSGSSVVFGLIIDLLGNNAGNNGDPVSDLPSGGYTLNITANTS